MTNFTSFAELNEHIKQEGEVLTVSMEMLRKINGASKLGSQVRENISDDLKKLGLKHYPKELPSYQSQCVRVYRSGTTVDKLYGYMMDIENNDNMKSNINSDKKIKEFTNDESRDIVNKIKLLVCD